MRDLLWDILIELKELNKNLSTSEDKIINYKWNDKGEMI